MRIEKRGREAIPMTRHIQPPHLPEQRDLVEHYIPDGAVIAVRDGGVLVILSEGER